MSLLLKVSDKCRWSLYNTFRFRWAQRMFQDCSSNPR